MSRPYSVARDRQLTIFLLAHVMNLCDQIEQLAPEEDGVKLGLVRDVCRCTLGEAQKKLGAKP